ncbi:MAG: DUF4338 domain-containing protein, partial [Phycisphaerae bacterium]|nr:DUF4338 domain-containing protein [Phycisphaerae bacterium]
MPDLLQIKKLRRIVIATLKKQGYQVNKTSFFLNDLDRDKKRDVHNLAKAERIEKRKDFIIKNVDLIKKTLIDGKCLEVEKIKPCLIEVQPDTKWENLFRWWNLVWWSLPYEHAYGRQIRFIVWDKYHKAPIGLIGLQSPILSWSVRDNYLNIPTEGRDYWVNQSMSAQRLGALPPYNSVLGGKLVAYLMTSNSVRNVFKRKYFDKKTILQKRKLPPRLLFITTTGAYGKSSVYTRLKYQGEEVATFIGYTQGSGSFHIPNDLFDRFVALLDSEGYDVRRGYGSGPSRKLRLIDQALHLLGFENGSSHGVKRAVYLFPMIKNLDDVIQRDVRPK